MRERRAPGREPTEESRRPAPPALAPRHEAILRMQRGHGNAAVARLLQRTPAAPAETTIRAGAGSGYVLSATTAPAYEQPDENSKLVADLPGGTTVKLLSEAGAFHGIEHEGRKAYVKTGFLATAIDELPQDKIAEFEARAKAASDAIDAAAASPDKKEAAKHATAAPLRGTGTAPAEAGVAFPKWFMDLQHKLSMRAGWGMEEEQAQQVLDDYATWYMKMWHGKVPASLKLFFEYIGRSSIHSGSAASKYQSVGKFGGGISEKTKRPLPNWCTQATSIGVLGALRSMGFVPTIDDQTKWFQALWMKRVAGEGMTIQAPQAYSAPLLPGDMVMYLFDGCQYGGHTVTVVDDLGESFTHVSGNAGDAIGVMIGEAKRMKGERPRSKTGKEEFVLANCNKVGNEKEMKESTEYIARFDFGHKKLTYSIVRYSALYKELESLPDLDPAEKQKVLAKFNLREVPVPAVMAEATPSPSPAAATV